MSFEQRFTGISTALATPFFRGEIDWPSLKKLLRQQLDAGIKCLVVCGTTAETPTLTLEEREKIFRFIASEVSGAVTLVMGTGSNSTRETVLATKAAKALGAEAALVVVPYYNKPSQRGLVAHFSAVAQSCELPLILYNVPSRTITRFEIETVQELARIPGIVAIKEASGDLEFGQAISHTTPLLLLSGDDASCIKLVASGSKGVISVISHLIPAEMIAVFRRAKETSVESAEQEWALKYGPLNRDLYLEANPIPLKYALHKLGLIASPELRLPLTELDPKFRARVDEALKAGGLI